MTAYILNPPLNGSGELFQVDGTEIIGSNVQVLTDNQIIYKPPTDVIGFAGNFTFYVQDQYGQASEAEFVQCFVAQLNPPTAGNVPVNVIESASQEKQTFTHIYL